MPEPRVRVFVVRVDDDEDERRTLRQNLTEALSTIHRAGLVHSDVQTSNDLRVGDVWKLADLGAAVAIGEPIRWLLLDRRFVPSHLEEGSFAASSNDWWSSPRCSEMLV